MGAKRKAEDGGENPPPNKKYKIFTTKNVKQNIIKRKSELCDNNDKSDKRKKPNSQGSKMGTKRKAEDVGENTPPKKVYKIFRSKNAQISTKSHQFWLNLYKNSTIFKRSGKIDHIYYYCQLPTYL